MMLMPIRPPTAEEVDPTVLPAVRLIAAPMSMRRWARGLAFTLLFALVALFISPCQQTVSGSGRVIAFSPGDRQQKIQSPVKGRILRWFVKEGDRVKAGDPLLEIRDNDPAYFERLRQQHETVSTQVESYTAQVQQMDAYVRNLAEARDEAVEEAQTAVDEAEQKVRSAKQKRQAAEAARDTEAIHLERSESLFTQGLISKRKLELQRLKATKTQTDLESARADLQAAERALVGKRAALRNKRAEADAKVENARASKSKAETALGDAQNKLVDIDTKLARQSNQLVSAPVDAFVLRIDKAPGQEQVKAGEQLAVLVPNVADRVAEVMVDGNDAAIITPGRQVRLQFEGWPAVQFAGWPSVAVGTFGGVVAFVDSASDSKGDFRVIVRPDPDFPEWPQPVFLRQGTRTKAWILLERVTMGYELWRRFNGFPPRIDIEKKGSSKDPGSKAGKGHTK